jgi:hypothetical protein
MPKRFRKKAEEQLLMALACGATVEQAAAKCGLSERTVYRRLEDASFCQRLQKVIADMVKRTAGMLTASGGEASKTFLALLKEPTPPATRHAAARSIIELGIKTRETADLEQRIASLEQRVGEEGDQPKKAGMAPKNNGRARKEGQR